MPDCTETIDLEEMRTCIAPDETLQEMYRFIRIENIDKFYHDQWLLALLCIALNGKLTIEYSINKTFFDFMWGSTD